MFLSQPLLDVLIGRDIRDVDEFLRQPSFSDLNDPFSIPNLRTAVDRVLLAIKEHKRIGAFGDYDCDGVLASHILQSGLRRFGAEVRVCLPHRDDGYGLSAPAVHQFSLRGIHLLLTVDNGINAQSAVRLARRLGIEVIVIDHHRIQQKADTLAVWSEEFCGAGLAAMFMIGMAVRTGWSENAIERLTEGASLYAAVASIADCVPLLGKTRILTKLGLAALAQTRHCGMRELLKASSADPLAPDSEDVAFRIAPRINAAGRVDHPAAALAVVEAVSDPEAARASVARLDQLNLLRRALVRDHFDQLCGAMAEETPAAVVLFCEQAPKGIAGLLASKCVERFGVPSIILVPSGVPGIAVGSGRSVPGFDLEAQLQSFAPLFDRFGGHAQAIGVTLRVDRIGELRSGLESACRGLAPRREPQGEGNLSLCSLSATFYAQLRQLEPFGEGNRAPVFRIEGAEVIAVRNRWVRLHQGRHTLESFNWKVEDVKGGMRGDWLIEFRSKTRNVCGFVPK
jgi:single-stranded-DNA-specific exonuclease